jgi:hypothetical protein
MRQSNKGIVLTISAVVEGLFFIGVISLLFWLFISQILEIHNSATEANTERHAINLANVLISSEKLAYGEGGTCNGVPYTCNHYTTSSTCVNANCGWVPQDQSCYGTPYDCGHYTSSSSCTDAGCTSVYEKEGKISRGILDSSKLDSIFTKNSVSYEPKDIGMGYPNSLNLVKVVDLESCQDTTCDMWMAVLSAPTTIEGLSVEKFTNCMSDTAKTDVGSVFRSIAGYYLGGPIVSAVASLWDPWDIEECVKNAVPENVKSFFTGSLISSEGLPILIRYPNGDLHVGRIVVGVGEWV